MKKTYQLHAKVWVYSGKAAWRFVTIPADIAQDINFFFSEQKHGFGSIRVQVTVGETHWKTSIFPDKESGGFLLPLKREVRVKEKIADGQQIEVQIEIER